MFYFIVRFLSKFLGHNLIINYYRNLGMNIGKDTHIFSRLVSSEPFMITIGDNCTISTNVSILTHDASIGVVWGRNVKSDMCGAVKIGDRCFVGSGAIILPGVNIPNRCIIAAGSIVTKSVPRGGVIIGGNPAKVICSIDDYLSKNEYYFLSLHGMSKSKRKQFLLQNKNRWLSK